MPTAQKTESWFRTELTLGQAISMSIVIVGAVITGWFNLGLRVTVVEQQIEMLKEEKSENKEFQRNVMLELKNIQYLINSKEDRK